MDIEQKSSIEYKTSFEKPFSKEDLLLLLNLKNQPELKWLYSTADRVRRKYMGDEIFLRGIIEFSNHCRKSCDYCGIRAPNSKVNRYRIPDEGIIDICMMLEKQAITTVVLQSGEDLFYTKEKIGGIIKIIKEKTNLAITLSVGERDEETYRYWKNCGMDRYLLRFETSNQKIFKAIHPDDNFKERLNCIRVLKELGIQTGSGFMIGLPQTGLDDIANDILLCRELDLDMIGIGPFIPHPDTPLYIDGFTFDLDFYTKVLAVLRMVNYNCHIPATTAFDAFKKEGRNLALQRGANVFMPNVTPEKYRRDYLLYPGKPCVDEPGEKCIACSAIRITSLGRKIGKGKGHSLKKPGTYQGLSAF